MFEHIAIGDFVNRVKRSSYHQDRVVALCLAAISGAILLALTEAWPSDTHDGLIHFHRIRALADALRAGVLFPRWFPDFIFSYGYPALNYYAPDFYYPPALLHLAGFDILAGVRLSLAFGFALSAWWMFRLLRLFVTLRPAIVSVFCFQFFPYRMFDLFVRGAFPEFIAFMWLPLVAYYTTQVVMVGQRADRTASVERPLLVKAGLAWAGLILTHNLTALMAALVLGGALVLFILVLRREHAIVRRIATLSVGTLAIGSLLSAWYALPALLEIGWVTISQGLFANWYLGHFVGWTDLIDSDSIYLYT